MAFPRLSSNAIIYDCACQYETHMGLLDIASKDGAIVYLCLWRPEDPTAAPLFNLPELSQEPDAPIVTAALQVYEYLAGNRRVFTFPFKTKGTDFQQLVWKQLARLPYGVTSTYKEVAGTLGKATAARAVGQACSLNPVMLAVPCHRVVSKSGTSAGFIGGVHLKDDLLALEQQYCS